MLEAENLVKQFEKNEKKHKKVLFSAVDHVSLHIKEGEIVGVLGPNGAGKTTLLRMLGCLMQPTEGVVRYSDGDRIITEQTEIKRQIGYLSGNTKLYGRLSTRELLTIAGNIYGLPENVHIIKCDINDEKDAAKKIEGMEFDCVGEFIGFVPAQF